MKKNMLFVVHGLGIGDIETCLVNVLNALPMDRFNVDVLLEHPIYTMKDRIRVPVNYIDVSRYMLDPSESRDAIKQNGGALKNFGWFLRYAIFRVLVKLRVEKKWIVFKKLPQKYDIAISYSHEGYCPYYLIDKVDADKKVMWYHKGVYDYQEKKRHLDSYYYNQFDHIVCVSNDCKSAIVERFTKFKHKFIVLRNLYDIEFIRQQAKAFIPKSYADAFNIVTVGRLSEEKQPDVALEVCKKLIDSGCSIIWRWVGDGVYKEELLSKISDLGMEKHFLLEGNQINPYPYIQNADLYVQTSRYEAFCTTITEAQILSVPIVATNVGGVKDQITNDKNGLICESNVDSLVEAIESLISQPQLREKFAKELSENPYQQTEYLEEYLNTVLS